MADQITISMDTANASLGAIGIALNAMTADGPPTGEDAIAAVQAMEQAQTELMKALKE
jgi:hypothetical protein